MVVSTEVEARIAEAVGRIYDYIDSREPLANDNLCGACGKCCDFTGFGHRLYVTTPELIYLKTKLGEALPRAESLCCPWFVEGKCSIHDHRFAGCRIFFCKGDAQLQSELSEHVLKDIKTICTEFDLPYNYMELSAFLNSC